MTTGNHHFAPQPRPDRAPAAPRGFREVPILGYIQKRNGRYRARYRNPLGRVTSSTFDRKADAQRFLAEMETDKARGTWIDPRHADLPLARWSDEFLALARRLSPSTQETYRGDLTKYVLPTLGAYRIGAIPPDVVENWLNDELEAGVAASSVHRHYRTLRRVLQVAVDKQKTARRPRGARSWCASAIRHPQQAAARAGRATPGRADGPAPPAGRDR